MSEEIFKLPGSSYTELAKIIRAYSHAGDEASLDEVANRAAVDKTFVSRNNGFLLSIGILTGGQKKSLTENGKILGQALDHELIDEIQQAWQVLVLETDFFKKILSAVRIRNGMDAGSLRSHIAYTSGAPNKPITMTGANAAIDVMKQAGCLQERDGKIVATSIAHSEGKSRTLPTAPPATYKIDSDSGPIDAPLSRIAVLSDAASNQRVTLDIRLNINCSVEELDGLGASLKKLLSELGSENP